MASSIDLFDRCRGNLPDRVWEAGDDYVLQGRVKLEDVDSGGLDALVAGQGNDRHDVSLDWSDKNLLVAECSCTSFAKGNLCKHIAATILELDARKWGFRVPGRKALELVHASVISPYGDDDDDDDWDDGEPGCNHWDDDDEFSIDGPPGALGGLLNRMGRMLGLPAPARSNNGRKTPAVAPWRTLLQQVQYDLSSRLAQAAATDGAPRKERQIWYRLNIDATRSTSRLTIDLLQRQARKAGGFGKLKKFTAYEGEYEALCGPEDRELLGVLVSTKSRDPLDSYDSPTTYGWHRCDVAPALYDWLLPRLCATGRFGLDDPSDPDANPRPLAWDNGPPWRFELQIQKTRSGKEWQIEGRLRRSQPDGAEETLPISAPRLLMRNGLLALDDRLARFDAGQGFAWIALLRQGPAVTVPLQQQDEFLTALWQVGEVPPLEMPDELRWEQLRPAPQPRLSISKPRLDPTAKELEGRLSFDYLGRHVAADDAAGALVDAQQRRVLHRDRKREQEALADLLNLGAKEPPVYQRNLYDVRVNRNDLPRIVQNLVPSGWHVEADGLRLRRAGDFKLSVTSGVDWFELDGQADFEGIPVALPELLAAARRGDPFVVLGDGTHGMLPEEWLSRYAPLAEMGTAEDGKLRFVHSQAVLLDAWLAAQPNVDVDATFDRVRTRLRSFAGVEPKAEPPGFVGQLRQYQREGLGWLGFLEEFGFGGCLADDMGLGKTIQVLALLESRRAEPAESGPRPPSLVVVPRSLVFNWIEEARRFAPQLRVLDYTGLARSSLREQFGEYQLVITTYGTLRRDIGVLKDFEFDYGILDESQAIKNGGSQAAKACRLLKARHRLAMTGTPVENHLGELWSLFEFLNPGMLGHSQALKLVSSNGNGSDSGSLELLARSLRPFLLRRTKEQVLSELPDKTEQTLYCELEGKQRKLYDELRDHYRGLLTKRIEVEGLKKSKFQVLEALLRLRQAACHPGLIDRSKSSQPSAKIEALLEQLDEVISEGHKALVFSQFTSLLAIVRHEMDRRKITYEYLDGRTRNRQEKVERFQRDERCPVFLISLKAGGHGLNLTAADYVFILDPWWNPAVEAQAVDRAHRIGQTRNVFAYRLIARDTVEEKILELQGEKRKLAEAIISADNSLISNLTADDLRLLLS